MNGEELLRVMEQLDDKIINEAERYEISRVSKSFSWKRLGSLVACFLVCLFVASVLGSRMMGFLYKSGNSDKIAESIHSNLSAGSQEEYFSVSEDIQEAENITVTEEISENEMLQEDGHTEGETGTGKVKESDNDLLDCETTTVTIEYRGEFILIQTYWNPNLSEVEYVMPEKGRDYCFIQLEDALTYYEGQENIKYYVEIHIFGDYLDENNQLVYGELTGTERKNDEQVQKQVQEEEKRLQGLGYEVELEENILQGYLSRKELDRFPIEEQYGYTFKFKNE